MTPNIDEIRALLEKATKGPWEARFRFGQKTTVGGRQRFPICDTGTAPHGEANVRREEANAALIVALVNATPDLLAQLEKVTAENTYWREQANVLDGQIDGLKAENERLRARADFEGGQHDAFKSEELRQRLRAEAAEARIKTLAATTDEMNACLWIITSGNVDAREYMRIANARDRKNGTRALLQETQDV